MNNEGAKGTKAIELRLFSSRPLSLRCEPLLPSRDFAGNRAGLVGGQVFAFHRNRPAVRAMG